MTARTKQLETKVTLVNQALGNEYRQVGSFILDDEKQGVRRQYRLQKITTDKGGRDYLTEWLELRLMDHLLTGMIMGITAANVKSRQHNENAQAG